MNRQSIKLVYKNYFQIIESYFGSIKHYLGNDKESHIDLGIHIANYPLISDLIYDAIYDIDIEIEKFWTDNAKSVFDYIESSDTLKCLYSGEISPVILEDFVKKSCLYVDSVIIPDPIFNLSIFQKQIILNKKYYLNKLIRHVFNVWKLGDLIMSESEDSILYILPINLNLIKENDRNLLIAEADKQLTKYVSELTDHIFPDYREAMIFLEKIQTCDAVFQNIQKPGLLPIELQKSENFVKFLVDFSEVNNFTEFQNKTKGWNFGLYLKSQFIRVQEHKLFCNRLGAEPIYDYELPWFFFNYEIGCGGLDDAIINALQKEKFNWITQVPLSALRILRNENKLDYMRNLLRKSITDLKAKKDNNLLNVGQQIEINFKEAFKRQSEEIESLQKEVSKIMKKDIPITTGGFIAAYIPGLSNVISVASAGRDIKNLLEKRAATIQQIVSLKSNIINLLMKSHDNK